MERVKRNDNSEVSTRKIINANRGLENFYISPYITCGFETVSCNITKTSHLP